LLDIDGVLTVSWKPLPGAVESVRWLQSHHVDFRLVTNTSSKSGRQIAAHLEAAGMVVDTSQILTAVTSASSYLGEHHRGLDCLVVNEGDIGEDLHGVNSVGPQSAGVVLLGGAGPSIGYDELNAVFRLALDGIPVVALHRNTRFQTASGPALDMGAFIVGLEAAAGIEVAIVGKPAPAFFHAALSSLGVTAPETVMVGDDIESDVIGAQAGGITGVLVRTGKFRPADLDHASGRPDRVIDDIGQLPALLEGMARA
jgi:HAD superfamily hydrolase (TIGR01458 family)